MFVCPRKVYGRFIQCVSSSVPSRVDTGEDGLLVSDPLLTGRLQNSDVLQNLEYVLSHLLDPQRLELSQLM